MWEAQYYKHEDTAHAHHLGRPRHDGLRSARRHRRQDRLPRRRTSGCIAGDGGFQMTAAELSTIVQEDIKINVAVINNGFLGMVRQWQEVFYDKSYACSPILWPDFVKLAEAHGLPGSASPSAAGQVRGRNRRARHEGTFVIDFRVEKEDSVYPMLPPGAALHEMIRRPSKDPLLVETTCENGPTSAADNVLFLEASPLLKQP